MSDDDEPKDESAEDSEQQVEEQPADSEQSTEQPEEQPAESEQPSDQAEEQPSESGQPAEQTEDQAADGDQTGEQPVDSDQPATAATADETVAFAGDERAINESDQPAEQEEQPDDDCSGWEQDPVSFSTYVAKYVAKMQIAPNVDVLAKSVACKDERHCDVTLSNGVVMRVAWEPSTRITLGRWDSNGVVLRSIYKYSCRGGQLILTFKDFRRGPE